MVKRKVQKDKQRSTKHTYKAKDWISPTPLKIGGELTDVLQTVINGEKDNKIKTKYTTLSEQF
jgi:hypothetical protein